MIRFSAFNIGFSVSFPAFSILTLSVLLSGKNSLMMFCLASAFVHELGHILMISKYLGKPKFISFDVGKIDISCDFSKASYREELIIHFAGPVSNLILSSITYFVFVFSEISLFKDIFISSLCIGFFNLLPLKSLDGGNILQILLFNHLPDKMARIVNVLISVVVIFPILVFGLLFLIVSKYNYSLLLVTMYLICTTINKELR